MKYLFNKFSILIIHFSEKSKIFVFFLASFFITKLAHSQCDFSILNEADCGANGVIEIIPNPAWSAPYSYELNYPNGNQATGTFSTTSTQVYSLQGDINDYELIMFSGEQSCTLNISLNEYSLSPNFFIPNTNGFAIQCNGLCDGEIKTTPINFPFKHKLSNYF